MVVLCNQGCGTHVYFKIVDGKKKPFNVLDNEKHDCPMLHMAKLWGGRYNTIPMGKIFPTILMVHETIEAAHKSRNIDDILQTLKLTVSRLKYVVDIMAKQETQNDEWSNELEAYKKKLVDDQRRREERKSSLAV